MSLPDDVRRACRAVAERAVHVRIADTTTVDAYARALPIPPPRASVPGSDADIDGAVQHGGRVRGAAWLERAAAHSLTLGAINFGSGWFPTLRKPDGMSGFRTVEAGVRGAGPWTARQLAAIGTDTVAAALGQDAEHPLMPLFATALRELGERVLHEHDGRFLDLARSGGGSAVRLAEELATWPTWADTSEHAGEPVPFLKRAQITAADLHLEGIAPARDLAALTMFADNLVPHVLRLDGVLLVEPDLVARIEAGELLTHGSAEEVELRACAVEAVERIVAARRDTSAAIVDGVLWSRGGGPRYKAAPRHRSRTTAY